VSWKPFVKSKETPATITITRIKVVDPIPRRAWQPGPQTR
jgi:hypothetical protein